ncbi:MAG: amidophosphoribosyltransferase [Candidatus Levybacteria bacterium]|nr:amidophosphoribosyltransferase [Candidatus Levybacteria bacterium]
MKEKCAVFGVYGRDIDAARLTYFGLYALQHRGQESSGIAASDGKRINLHKAMGLVAQVYNEHDFDKLHGFLAIGHNRYATFGGSTDDHIQPAADREMKVVLAHNGNLPSIEKLRKFLVSKDISVKNLNDSELMLTVISYFLSQGQTLEKAVTYAFPLFTGAFSLLVMTKDKIAAVRDQYGIRPFSIGTLNHTGYVFSSETCALDTVNARYLRDVLPGELVIADKHGLHSYQLAKPTPKLDIFEFVYFTRPDSILLGKRVAEVRKNLGRNLAREAKVKADVVIPVPDSAVPAALGYAEVSKIPFDFGLVKNRYIGRTFIMPDQRLRDRGVQMKLNPIGESIKGKRVVVIDDSIVRGTTAKKLVKLLRDAGAKEVHLMSSCPPTRFPDFYGINTPTQAELIAATMPIQKIKEFIGADSLHYLSYKGLIDATGLPEDTFCTSCFTGIYPIDIGENEKHINRNIEGFFLPQH